MDMDTTIERLPYIGSDIYSQLQDLLHSVLAGYYASTTVDGCSLTGNTFNLMENRYCCFLPDCCDEFRRFEELHSHLKQHGHTGGGLIRSFEPDDQFLERFTADYSPIFQDSSNVKVSVKTFDLIQKPMKRAIHLDMTLSIEESALKRIRDQDRPQKRHLKMQRKKTKMLQCIPNGQYQITFPVMHMLHTSRNFSRKLSEGRRF
ncbi:hypothetical protein BC829DRAFT_108012 [Chytridium lagenaria]|nr:hypothetical protein BC829DRAFT_108012 [Chytridium lagenaria]